LSVFGITLYAFRIELMHSHFDRNGLVVELWGFNIFQPIKDVPALCPNVLVGRSVIIPKVGTCSSYETFEKV
jgi:hypothetical protein